MPHSKINVPGAWFSWWQRGAGLEWFQYSPFLRKGMLRREFIQDVREEFMGGPHHVPLSPGSPRAVDYLSPEELAREAQLTQAWGLEVEAARKRFHDRFAGLPMRIKNALLSSGIDTPRRLSEWVGRGGQIPGIGPKSVGQIKEFLRSLQ